MKPAFVAFDTETTGLQPHSTPAQVFAYSTATEAGAVSVVRLDGLDGLGDGVGLQRLRNFWGLVEVGAVVPVMHQAKFDLSFSEKALGRRLAHLPFEDTKLLAHILRNDYPGHGLKSLAWDYGGMPMDDEVEVKKHLRGGAADYSQVPVEVMNRYQRADADRTQFLWQFFRSKLLAGDRQWAECYEWEKRLVPVTMAMEARGFMVDRKRCAAQVEFLRGAAMRTMNEAESVLGRRLDLGKDNAVRAVVYGEMKMPVIKRTDTGLPSIEKDVLADLLRGPGKGLALLDLIVRYKSWRRGATILEGYLECADDAGVIHPTIHTCQAITGRQSCSDPNLQSVERAGDLSNPYPIGARKVFRPRPGHVHFHIDYAGIELRLLVNYSKDDELLAEIARPGGDPHYLAAQTFYPKFSGAEMAEFGALVAPYVPPGIDAWEKDSDEFDTLRGGTKNTNFAVPYGAGAKKAALSLGLPAVLGRRRFDMYRARWPKLVGLSQTVQGWVRETGGVSTAFGRFLHVPKGLAYKGTNYLIQGTGAEILKRSQVRVADFLEKATGGEVRLLLPIHDELIFEYPRKRLGDAVGLFRKVREIMIDFPVLDVPLEIDLKVAAVDWATKSKFSLEG